MEMDDGSTTGFAPIDNWDEQYEQMNTGGEAKRAVFYKSLRKSMFFVPHSPDGEGLSLLSTQHGEVYIPAFTTSDEFQKWGRREDGATVRTFEILHGTVIDDSRLAGIVVNPFGNSLILKRPDLAEIENIATGMTRERVDHSGRLMFEAAKHTSKLANAFSDALTSSGMEVYEAYILTARQENETQPHLLFLIDFNGDRKILFPSVAQAIQPHMKIGTNFELLKANFDTLEAARAKAAPAYKA